MFSNYNVGYNKVKDMSIRDEILEKILDQLKKARSKPPCGLTITELAKNLGVSRTVVRMHLLVLETKDVVESIRVQKASVYYIKKEK
jgi:DNA-binding GntR family transcriptional regulator